MQHLRKSCYILGTRVDCVRAQEAFLEVRAMRERAGQFAVTTPNPDIVLYAHRSPYFRQVLNQASLNIPDGVGLVWAARMHGVSLPERVTGVDLVARLVAHGLAHKWKMGILSEFWESERFTSTRPSIRVWRSERALAEENPTLDILFVAFGAPRQEVWIAHHLPLLPGIKIAMSVGGAFDMLSGRIPRAPRLMQHAGLEWLWRVVVQPWRIPRIYRSLIAFPLAVATSSYSVHDHH